MLKDLEITKSEYLSMLRNRGKSVWPSISNDKLLKKVKYLKKSDLIHLLTIRGIVLNEYSLDNIIDALFKDIHKKKQANVVEDIYKHYHKQKLTNLKGEIYRNLHKKQNEQIIHELKEFKKLKRSNLIDKENISQEGLKEIKPRNTLKKLAQLRDIETIGLTKSNVIYILLRSQKHPEETKYLKYLQTDPPNEIKSKINEIRKYIIELGMMLDRADRVKIGERLKDEINYLCKSDINELSKILLDLE